MDGSSSAAAINWHVSEARDFALDATAGTIGGVVGILCGQPFDVVKTRMQAGAVTYRSATACFQHILRTEGPGAFFKGSLISSLGQVPNNFLTFGHYGLAQRTLERAFPVDHHAHHDELVPPRRPLWQSYIAGSWAGLAQSAALAPFEHIKVQQQLMGQSGGKPLGMMEALLMIHKAKGLWRGLMRGWVATAWRDVPTFGLYFSTFELSKCLYEDYELQKRRDAAQAAGASPEELQRELRRPIRIPEWVLLLGGGLAGLASWTFALPSDVIKSNIQGSPIDADPRSLKFMRVAQRLYREGGVSAFTRGMAACLTRSIPVNAVTFAGYELSLRELRGIFTESQVLH